MNLDDFICANERFNSERKVSEEELDAESDSQILAYLGEGNSDLFRYSLQRLKEQSENRDYSETQ